MMCSYTLTFYDDDIINSDLSNYQLLIHLWEEKKDFGMLPSNHSICHIVARNIRPSSPLINVNAICESGTKPL